MATRQKPSKPYPSFPLTPHDRGKWCKKIQGKVYYFGRWDDWEGALREYEEKAADLHAGRKPPPRASQLTIARLCNHFLTFKRGQLDSGEITAGTFSSYATACEIVYKAFGREREVASLRPDDFGALRRNLAAKYGKPSSLKNRMIAIRCLFRHADSDHAMLLDKPPAFGNQFKLPSAATLRNAAARDKRERFLSAKAVRKLIRTADPEMRAAILLGINCGYGNKDVSELEPRDFSFAKTGRLSQEWRRRQYRGFVSMNRTKNGVDRRCPLWPETARAIRTAFPALDMRPAGPLFRTKDGEPVVQRNKLTSGNRANTRDTIGSRFRAILQAAGLYRHGLRLNFYTLRHVFYTIAEQSGDIPAARKIMGHVDSSMSDPYRLVVTDDRLLAVVTEVRRWLWPPERFPRRWAERET